MVTMNPKITVTLDAEGPHVKISAFENLSPVKIEKCFEAVSKEWYRLRAVTINQRKKAELEERAGAQNG